MSSDSLKGGAFAKPIEGGSKRVWGDGGRTLVAKAARRVVYVEKHGDVMERSGTCVWNARGDDAHVARDRPSFVTLTFRGEPSDRSNRGGRRDDAATLGPATDLRGAGLGETRGARDVEGGGEGEGRHVGVEATGCVTCRDIRGKLIDKFTFSGR